MIDEQDETLFKEFLPTKMKHFLLLMARVY